MLRVKKLCLQERVYTYTEYCGFGDMWAVTSYLLRVSEEIKKPASFWAKSSKQRDIIRSITPLLKSNGTINIVDSPSRKMKILNYCEPFRVKFVPTYKRWRRNKSKIIAYQFDGSHLAEDKNLSMRRLLYLLKSLDLMGYELVDVGHHKPLSYIVDVLSQCKFFVGCPSGLSVVSISVGNPVFLITRTMEPLFLRFMLDCQYCTKHVQMFSTVDEFLIHVKRMSRSGGML